MTPSSNELGHSRKKFKNRSVSDPTLSDTDFKNNMAWAWTTLNIMFRYSTTLVRDEIIPRQHHLSQQHQVDRVTVPKIQIHQIFFDDPTLTQILLI